MGDQDLVSDSRKLWTVTAIGGAITVLLSATSSIRRYAQRPVIRELWWRAVASGDPNRFFDAIAPEQQINKLALTVSTASLPALRAITQLASIYHAAGRPAPTPPKGRRLGDTRSVATAAAQEWTTWLMKQFRSVAPWFVVFFATQATATISLRALLAQELRKLEALGRPIDAAAEADMMEVSAGLARTKMHVLDTQT